MDETISGMLRFCLRIEEAGIPYHIGGSVAAGQWGEPRQTNDVDLAVWISPSSVEAFLGAFDDSYLVSRTELLDSLESMEQFASVQVLDTEIMLKFDCFLQRFEEIDLEMRAEGRTVAMGDIVVRVACAEDIIVQKLRWYELTHRTSERQWRDLVGIVKVTTDLRWELIERWALYYGVGEALAELKQVRDGTIDPWLL